MILEKDFLYRVPVKNVLVTTPRQLDRNPEILVDLEGGEFMHGNILDANSTNKLINQSVKDAIDKNIADGSFVTKDLLDKEVDRATSAESDLQAAIDTKADAIALSNYVLTTALNLQVDTLNTAISAKLDAGNYMTYLSTYMGEYYEMEKGLIYLYDNGFDHGDVKIGTVNITLNRNDDTTTIYGGSVSILRGDENTMTIGHTGIEFETDKNNVSINDSAIDITSNKSPNKTKLGLGYINFYYNDDLVKFSSAGIKSNKFHDCLVTSDGTFIPLSQFVDIATYDSKIAELEARITALETKHT